MNFRLIRNFSLGTALLGFFGFAYFGIPQVLPTEYKSAQPATAVESEIPEEEVIVENVFKPIRVETPEFVRAIYMSQCVAGTPSFREDLVKVAEETEVNAIIVDIKDYTGKLSFIPKSETLKEALSDQCYAPDMKEFIKYMNEKDIYVIGRITVFQDPYYSQKHPELAVKKYSDQSQIWEDYKGINYIEAGAEDFWKYIVDISKEAYDIGFDELNYDYIRFPSDGNMRDIFYPFSEQRLLDDPDKGKAEVVREFFKYLHSNMKAHATDTPPVLSADLFGMTTTNADDLNIGQILEYAEPYFDYLAPMVYPSHYPTGFNGWVNPNHYPYEIIKFSMDRGVEKLIAASSSPNKLRPWLQDFDYGGDYDVEEVRAQIQATYDAGLNSWMLWAPSNRYTLGALKKEGEEDLLIEEGTTEDIVETEEVL